MSLLLTRFVQWPSPTAGVASEEVIEWQKDASAQACTSFHDLVGGSQR